MRILSLLAVVCVTLAAVPISNFRPPSVPLIVTDPYISIWSPSDRLFDSWPVHWSGPIMALAGMIRVDGVAYRFMGPGGPGGVCDNVVTQVGLAVYPTQTVYDFEVKGVHLTLTFSTPAVLTDNNLESFNTPASYITYNVYSVDGQSHKVQLYYDNTGEVAVDNTNLQIEWTRINGVTGQTVMRIGVANQNYLSNTNDQISWGFWYVSADSVPGLNTTMAGSSSTRSAFVNNVALPVDDTNQPRACNNNWPVLAVVWDLGYVSATPVSRHLTIVYDQVFAMKFFGAELTPLWAQKFHVNDLIASAAQNYSTALQSSTNFDSYLLGSLQKIGGDQYATICSLVYRQVTGGLQMTWNDRLQTKWLFMKEISSDGDVSTVDVIYPAAPFLLYLSPEALRLVLLPILAYSNNETAIYGDYIPYNLPWAAHHLGTWPICDIKPDEQEQMPMEETGNMFIMLAAIAQRQKDISYLQPYWDLLAMWGNYLNTSLPDPNDQLCTDDFEGPSPHNVNLAAKGIVGLGAYAYLLQLKGDTQQSQAYMNSARNFVQYWLTNAADGDHYRLQYNLPNTWSMKYNLMFQKILGLDLFPQSVFDMELNYYLGKQLNKFGVPLDDRATFTKADWSMWVGPLGDANQFNSITNALYLFANTTIDRVPFSDWYDTISARQIGFQARPVMGGIYSRMLFP